MEYNYVCLGHLFTGRLRMAFYNKDIILKKKTQGKKTNKTSDKLFERKEERKKVYWNRIVSFE